MASSVALSENLFLVSLAVGPSGRQEFELAPGEHVVGRKREASINLPHLDVSREHCIIFSKDGTLALFDQGSRNGTYVNGHRVAPKTPVSLFVNDTIGFGIVTTTVESYVDAKTPFLVYRVTKKIPNEVFKRFALEREKAQSVKRRADASADVSASKRTKSDIVDSAPSRPVVETSTIQPPSTETSQTNGINKPSNNCLRSRSDDMIELFVIDDSSNESAPSPEPTNTESKKTPGTESSPAATETHKTANSFLTKSVDENSTLKNGSSLRHSDLEASTPRHGNSSVNSTLKSNDDTRSIKKSGGKNHSGSSSKKLDSSKRPEEKSSSAKVGLFKMPQVDAIHQSSKKEKVEEQPRYVEISASRMEDEVEDVASKSGDLQTFSLISDDEDDDDGMMSSQIFMKSDDSQCILTTDPIMSSSMIDDEILEIFDSDDDSFFDHLSQTLSQSFVLPDEGKKKKCKVKSRKSEKSSKSRDESRKRSSSKVESSSSSGLGKNEILSSEPTPVKSTTTTPNEDKFVSKEKHSSSKQEVSKSKRLEDRNNSAVTRSKHKKDIAEKLLDNLVPSIDSGIKHTNKTVAITRDPVDRTSIDSKDGREDKVLPEASKKKETTKKALLIEAQCLTSNNKENRKLKSAGSVEPLPVVDVTVPVRRKTRVTFKELDMVEVKEFECLGNMKKLSTMPPHLLKEHPPKTPSMQWTSHMLRSCQQISGICQWNLKWLQEFLRVESDPPLMNFQPAPIENRYKKFDDYYFTMLSLVMHELWSELCRVHLDQTETQRFNIFSGVVEHTEPNMDNRTLFARCKIVTSGEMGPFLPNFGDVVGVQILAPNKERTHLYDSFGVVTRQFSRERIKPSRESNFLLTSLPSNGIDKDKMVICPIDVIFRASKTHSNVSNGCFVHIRVYKNIINQVKYFLALQKVFSSPLKSVILDPTTCVKASQTEKKEIKPLKIQYFQLPLNSLQKDAVMGVTNSVIHDESSISLIHGPPGTGKSSTIASIILHLLPVLRKSHRKGPPPKILLCAPSNTAIDEICLKLLDIRKKLPEVDKFKMTRVGNEKMMHPQVHEISSMALARRGLMSTPDPDTLETEIMLLRARIQGVKNGASSSKAKSQDPSKYHDLIEKCETRLAFYSKTLANIKSGKAPCNPEENRKLLYQEECNIIAGAEIIATTLSSSSSKKISDALTESTQFSCCIVDEATQATEPEILIPLHHNIRHMILVGDPQQLGPTVISKYAKERNFDWSLYHRLMNEWKEYKVAPLYPLREQYRMHIEIASFPSLKFYNGELKTPDFLQMNLPFSTYNVISHFWHESSNEESNDKEARFIVELMQKMCSSTHFGGLSSGIIVPYQSQRSLIVNLIRERKDRVLDGVTVNTIDSFQGQEKDVIILSCVRTKRIGFLSDRQRLNVALTRAKRCLLVVGNFEALKSDEVWAAMIADAKSRNRFVNANPNDRIASSLIFSKLFAKQSNNRQKPQRR